MELYIYCIYLCVPYFMYYLLQIHTAKEQQKSLSVLSDSFFILSESLQFTILPA
jgi:hypothetical protein